MAEAIQKSIKESNRDQGKPLKKHHLNSTLHLPVVGKSVNKYLKKEQASKKSKVQVM
eukprot:CAMPEP_0170472386 /NCGR_PEP_ID=MMETSP0123-20130129/14440_1 /TAXON_ID=182087 /ORGANISM="Favella ehrenbergii, Strain Fehren 1" /LENGTH=56 /DNA_ID=CAMNT_0010740651 /DNA_START=1420 /DNA_END=1587 /DNA_ORIENTATION=+